MSPVLPPLCWISALSAHGGAVDGRIALGDDRLGRFPEVVGDELQPFDRKGRIGRRRERLEQLTAAGGAGENKVGERRPYDAETIFAAHRAPSPADQ